MLNIDSFAYSNQVRSVDPAVKAGLALLALGLCLLLNRPAISLLTLAWMACLAVFWARIPARTAAGLFLVQAAFLLISLAGVALSISFSAAAAQPWRLPLGPLVISTGPASLGVALGLGSRAFACAAALNFLALTTPLVDLIDLGRRLRCPALLLDLMTLTYRFIAVLLERLGEMLVAQRSRLGYAGFRQGLSSSALIAARLFLETYQRSRKMELALESRGFQGRLQVLGVRYRHDPFALLLLAGLPLSLLLAWLFLLVFHLSF